MSTYQFSVKQEGYNTIVSGIHCFTLADTLDCGQAFRFSPMKDGRWCGIAHGKNLVLEIKGDTFILYNTVIAEFEALWRNYFDLDRDYSKIIRAISENSILKDAGSYARGIRILKQDPWEALCSFIISQNNNIPRIKGIIERLCENFGEPLDFGFAFPSPVKIASLSVDELAPLRSGFRAKYILDAARKVITGDVSLTKLEEMPLEEARQSLMTILGVGPKVADCALLFGFGRIECLPKDVWIKRALENLFDGALPACAEPYAGIVQQYIFHYARTGKIFSEKPAS